MTIVGIIVWYDESPAMLASAVAGLGKIADEIVAVDGAYALFPGARPRSHPNQAEAIVRAAETENVGLTIHRPREVFWGNEIEKRNLSLRLAAPFCTSDRDWILVWDADYHTLMADPERVRLDLQSTDKLACTYTILDGVDHWAGNSAGREFAQRRDVDTEWTIRTRGIYRWTPDLQYDNAHFLMRGTYDGETRWVYGPDLVGGREMGPTGGASSPLFVESHDLGRSLVVYHRRDERALTRREAADGYYRLRDASGIEVVDFGEGPVDPDTGGLIKQPQPAA